MFSGMANALPVWMGFSLRDSSLKGMTRLGDLHVGSQHRRPRQGDSEFMAKHYSRRKGGGRRGGLGNWCPSTSTPRNRYVSC